jgi:hypothetical protein
VEEDGEFGPPRAMGRSCFAAATSIRGGSLSLSLSLSLFLSLVRARSRAGGVGFTERQEREGISGQTRGSGNKKRKGRLAVM